jgi:hypothetical protein
MYSSWPSRPPWLALTRPLDDTFRAVLGPAERTIDGSNLRNSGGWYHDHSGRRTE